MATAAPAYAVSSHATTFTFSGAAYHCTDIQTEHTSEDPATAAATQIDLSTLDLAHGADRVMVNSPLVEPSDATAQNKTTVTVTFWGASLPPAGVTAALVTADANGRYKCTKSSITRKVGAYVEGQATFVLAPDAPTVQGGAAPVANP